MATTLTTHTPLFPLQTRPHLPRIIHHTDQHLVTLIPAPLMARHQLTSPLEDRLLRVMVAVPAMNSYRWQRAENGGTMSRNNGSYNPTVLQKVHLPQYLGPRETIPNLVRLGRTPTPPTPLVLPRRHNHTIHHKVPISHEPKTLEET